MLYKLQAITTESARQSRASGHRKDARQDYFIYCITEHLKISK